MIPDRDLAYRFPLLTGADVRAAQQALIRAGLLLSEPDGVYGPATRDAVARFQARCGLPADGVLARSLWPRLLPEPAATPDWRAALRPLLPRLTAPHGPPLGPGSRRWRLTAAGVVFAGADTPVGTAGAPITATATWRRFRAPFEASAQRFGVPVELLLACACTESGGRADAARQEPGYLSDSATPERVSPGLMQTLISTARDSLGDPTLDRRALLDPATSIAAGAALMRRQALGGRAPTGFDPPLVGIAYNAGSLHVPAHPGDNPWGLVQTAPGPGRWYADAFCAFFNDAMAVLAAEPPASATPRFGALL